MRKTKLNWPAKETHTHTHTRKPKNKNKQTNYKSHARILFDEEEKESVILVHQGLIA